MTIMDEFSRECLSIGVTRRLKADDVLDRLTWLFAQRGVSSYIRSDNGAELLNVAVSDTLREAQVLVAR